MKRAVFVEEIEKPEPFSSTGTVFHEAQAPARAREHVRVARALPSPKWHALYNGCSGTRDLFRPLVLKNFAKQILYHFRLFVTNIVQSWTN